MKTVYAIRCHSYSEDVIELYNEIKQCVKDDATVVLAMDQTKSSALIPAGVEFISITSDLIESLELAQIDNWGWQCGDYFYYAIAKKIAADNYWLIEPDVLFGKHTMVSFFEEFTQSNADFIAARISERDVSWSWHKAVVDFYPKVYGCAFPITRLSKRAINHLHAKRIILAKEFAKVSSYNWPNDEAFVASELGNNSEYILLDITKLKHFNFNTFSTVMPILKVNFRDKTGIFHPALSWDEFLIKFPDRLVKAINDKRGDAYMRYTLSKLEHHQIVDLFTAILKTHDVFMPKIPPVKQRSISGVFMRLTRSVKRMLKK